MIILMIAILMFPSFIFAQININDDMKSFSYAHKQASCEAGIENVLFTHTSGPGVITEQWFTGSKCFNEHTFVRYFIDGDEELTIEGTLYMMHGIGIFPNVSYPPKEAWGTKWLGHLASGGGLYNTIRIPFQKSIRATFVSEQSGYWWLIVRGVENYPVVIGDLKLPSNARLVLQRLEQRSYLPLRFTTLAHSSKNGLLFMVALAAESSDFNYLEGCYRLLVGNDTRIHYLSSGTEDFFLSAYYFNKGMFHTEHAGLTVFQPPGTMSAYKIFCSDPLLFRHSFHLVWRIGEEPRVNTCYNGSPEKCSRDGPVVDCVKPEQQQQQQHDENVELAETTITSYVWFYEWDN